MAYYETESLSIPGVSEVFEIDDYTGELDVVDYFHRNREIIKENLKNINLGTLVYVLKLFNRYYVVNVFENEYNGQDLIDDYLDLIIKKEEMMIHEVEKMKKIIRDNNLRDTVRKVVKEKELPKYVKKDITKYLIAGSKKHKKTRKSRKSRHVRKTRGKKH